MSATAEFKLSPGQEQAAKQVRAWLADPSRQPIFRLFGYAGTGKTSVARLLAEDVPGGAVYCAFTGKAALQMRRSGCADASTIHSLIYTPEEQRDGTMRFVFDPDGPASDAGIIVVDECSMVSEELAADLLSYRKPLLVLGDPAQLPPVGGDGVLTASEPDAMLTEIHRQAAESPIIRVATDIREGRSIRHGDYGAVQVLAPGALGVEDVVGYDQVLCGTHKRRLAYTRRMRGAKGYDSSLPAQGERLICTRNDKQLGIFNGEMFTVSKVGRVSLDTVALRVVSEDGTTGKSVDVKVRRECFEGGVEDLDFRAHRGLQQFDFGHVITVHKAQGSQWSNLLVYDESGVFRDSADRWLYTAVTRAADRLTVVR